MNKMDTHKTSQVQKKLNPLLQFKDVWKTYYLGAQTLDVLKGITLEIYEEEFVAVLGPSGSGKSTMMNLLGLLDVPSKGVILVENRDVRKMKESQLAQLRGKKIGFVFQQFNLISALTALENVMLPMMFQNVNENVRKKKAEELLGKVGLAERMHHKPTELSGGQQQRVAIARSLANNPDIILADEPTGNLDSASGKQIMDLLIGLHEKEKKTIILVTHDISLVKHAKRIIRLRDGQVVKAE
jgi:putative ABC transport system ATP-binding protein